MTLDELFYERRWLRRQFAHVGRLATAISCADNRSVPVAVSIDAKAYVAFATRPNPELVAPVRVIAEEACTNLVQADGVIILSLNGGKIESLIENPILSLDQVAQLGNLVQGNLVMFPDVGMGMSHIVNTDGSRWELLSKKHLAV